MYTPHTDEALSGFGHRAALGAPHQSSASLCSRFGLLFSAVHWMRVAQLDRREFCGGQLRFATSLLMPPLNGRCRVLPCATATVVWVWRVSPPGRRYGPSLGSLLDTIKLREESHLIRSDRTGHRDEQSERGRIQVLRLHSSLSSVSVRPDSRLDHLSPSHVVFSWSEGTARWKGSIVVPVFDSLTSSFRHAGGNKVPLSPRPSPPLGQRAQRRFGPTFHPPLPLLSLLTIHFFRRKQAPPFNSLCGTSLAATPCQCSFGVAVVFASSVRNCGRDSSSSQSGRFGGHCRVPFCSLSHQFLLPIDAISSSGSPHAGFCSSLRQVWTPALASGPMRPSDPYPAAPNHRYFHASAEIRVGERLCGQEENAFPPLVQDFLGITA